jgi:hypothetical protein
MPNSHITGVFDVEGTHFQAICSCGWLSTISFLEEVDLLRALHAHQIAVFGEGKADANLSVGSVTLSEQAQEGRGV